jgi:hypothetical protein
MNWKNEGKKEKKGTWPGRRKKELIQLTQGK